MWGCQTSHIMWQCLHIGTTGVWQWHHGLGKAHNAAAAAAAAAAWDTSAAAAAAPVVAATAPAAAAGALGL
jgi:hypothetical protein